MGTFEIGLNVFCIMILLQTYGGHGVECARLNVISSHKPIEIGTVSKCDLVEVGVKRKCITVDVGFEVSYAQPMPSDTVHFMLPVDQDVELSSPSPAPCLHACCHVPPGG